MPQDPLVRRSVRLWTRGALGVLARGEEEHGELKSVEIQISRSKLFTAIYSCRNATMSHARTTMLSLSPNSLAEKHGHILSFRMLDCVHIDERGTGLGDARPG